MNDYLLPYYITLGSKLKKINGYTVYADESNNMRKARIKDSTKDDLKYKFFVIGGIITPDNFDLNRIKDLYDKAEGFPEQDAKYKFFSHSKSKIEEAISYDRYYRLFNFLLENNIYMHLNVFNFWYFAIADIVDSLYDGEEINVYENRFLKNGMYEGLIVHYDEMYDLMTKYSFPDIPKESEKTFLTDIKAILLSSLNENFNEGDEVYEPIKRAIELIDKKIEHLNELIFIQDETPLEIINTLLPVYVHSAYAFKLNGIIFDNETYIESQMDALSLKKDLNCRFIDSKEEIAIQISDAIAGFTARYYEMIVNEDRVGNFCDRLKTDSIELKTIKKYQELLEKSFALYDLTHISVMSDHELESINRFNLLMSMFV